MDRGQCPLCTESELTRQDMNRFPSNRLRVEFDGPDVSQEMLYTLFRVRPRPGDGLMLTPIAIRSNRRHRTPFPRSRRRATLCDHLLFSNFPRRHRYQLSTRLFDRHEHCQLSLTSHRRRSHGPNEPAAIVLRAPSQSTRDPRLDQCPPSNSSPHHRIPPRHPQLHLFRSNTSLLCTVAARGVLGYRKVRVGRVAQVQAVPAIFFGLPIIFDIKY